MKSAHILEPNISLNEAFFLSLLTDAGWGGKRKSLTIKEREQLISCFKHPIKDGFQISFWLNHLFANFYALKHEELSAKVSDTYMARASYIRDELIELMKVYSGVTLENISDHRGEIQKAVSNLPEIPLKLLHFLSTQGLSRAYPNPYQIRQGSLSGHEYIRFKEVIDFSIKTSKANVKRGGNGKPIFEQMCRSLGELYVQATGIIPKRQSKFITKTAAQVETGPLHELTQTMHQLINQHLPSTLQTQDTPKLQFISRKIIEELKVENQNSPD